MQDAQLEKLKIYVDKYSEDKNHNLSYVKEEDLEDMRMFKCSKCNQSFYFCYDDLTKPAESVFKSGSVTCEEFMIKDIIE